MWFLKDLFRHTNMNVGAIWTKMEHATDTQKCDLAVTMSAEES